MKSSTRDFSTLVLLAGIVVFVVVAWLSENRWSYQEWGLLFLLCLVAEWRAIKLPGFGIFNPGEGFTLATACVLGPVPGALAALLSGVFSDTRKNRPSEIVRFNMGWALLTFSLAGAAYHTGGLLAATVVYRLVSAVLQAYGETRFSNLPLEVTCRHQLKETVLVTPAVFLFCYLSIVLLELQSLAVLLLLFPLELMFMYVKTRELSGRLKQTVRELESTQAELVATGRKAALGVMAAGIAHEINNPLAAAVTNIHMLKMVVTKPPAKQSLDLLQTSVERCQGIVARMLKYSRKTDEAGVPCRIEEIVNDAVLFCGRKFSDDSIDLKLQLEGCPDALGDPTELVQIVSNLLSNGHDAAASKVSVRYEASGNSINLQVEDDGSGIAKEQQTQVFEPFFTTKAVGSGTGLGLSISQGLARGMGGELKLLESRPGRTVFHLTLPTAR